MITVVPMMTEDEMLGKAYVHYRSWQETYRGLIDDTYLDEVMTLERCEAIARRYPDNLWVAKDGERVVGFVGCGVDREDSTRGEIYALYLLREYQGKGIGRMLVERALDELRGVSTVVLWVLRGNAHAIGFYAHCGFGFDGEEKTVTIGTPVVERRMLLRIESRSKTE